MGHQLGRQRFQLFLKNVSIITIPRCVVSPNDIAVEIDGKSKVAPKKQVTIPSLELLGAYLLARLISKVLGSFDFNFSSIVSIDSQIVLAWLQTPLVTLQVFVRNRIEKYAN